MVDISIRRAEPDDYQAFYEIYSCSRAYSGTLQLPYPSLEDWRRRLAEPPAGLFNLVAIVEERIVGSLGLHTYPHRPRKKHVGTLGIGVHDDWQGKGVGSALMTACIDLADNWLNLTRLELEVYTDNEPAIRLYEKFGFEHEGTRRRDAFRNGQYVDSYLMSRLRD
jgi:L-phenylalanine/L-methionine N-acetyltransferase